MGLSVALTPATTVVTVSKSMITNASFRTKKLPGEFDRGLPLSTLILPLLFINHINNLSCYATQSRLSHHIYDFH